MVEHHHDVIYITHDNDHVFILGNKIMDPHLHIICTASDHGVTIISNAWVLGRFLDPVVYKAANLALLQTIENCEQEFETFMSQTYLQKKANGSIVVTKARPCRRGFPMFPVCVSCSLG